MKFIIGVDEAGRGPLAGPVTVGAFGARDGMRKWILKNIFDNKLRDSKKLSSKKREEIYKKFLNLKKEGKVCFSVSHISNKIIDKVGISKAIARGVAFALQGISRKDYKGNPCKGVLIRLDGLLLAPAKYKNQKIIVRGDESDVFIACASIVAKVSRDRLMCRFSKKFPKYKLEIHKGYGTKLHRDLIRQFSLSDLHRMTFCANI